MKMFIGCSSRAGIANKYIEDAGYIAKRLSSKYDLVIGGVSDNGMFGKILSAFKDKNIYLYTLLIYNEELSKYNLKYKYLDSTFERTRNILEDSDKILFLPGGTGSLCEIFSMLEEIRTFNLDKKIILYNQDGYYYDIVKLITRLVKDKFNDISILNYIKVFNEKEDLLKYLEV